MSQAARATKAIITPRVDAICSGGLSLVVSLFVIFYGLITEAGMGQMLVGIQLYLFTDLLINWPHFMASYRLLYAKQSNFRRHPLVTIAMPIAAFSLLAYVVYWCYTDPAFTSTGSLGVLTAIHVFAPILLGWHYTGQSWGMTACFAFLSGLRMNDRERRLIRAGFYTLFVYHIGLAYELFGYVQGLFAEQEAGEYLMQAIISVSRVAVFIGFALGLMGFRELSLRTGQRIPMRVWLPWLATFSWYVMVDVYPVSFFLLQVFHALQYLSFPIRVELNRYSNSRHPWRHLVFYYVGITLVGAIAFGWPDVMDLNQAWLPVATATWMIINVHHYFIDAVIWKIRDPEVRHALFGHLEAA